jgi:hypothetical protein
MLLSFSRDNKIVKNTTFGGRIDDIWLNEKLVMSNEEM